MEEQEALTRRYRAWCRPHMEMREEEIRAVMNQFKNGEIGLLSTSMIRGRRHPQCNGDDR